MTITSTVRSTTYFSASSEAGVVIVSHHQGGDTQFWRALAASDPDLSGYLTFLGFDPEEILKIAK
jgi:hypothetical protein